MKIAYQFKKKIILKFDKFLKYTKVRTLSLKVLQPRNVVEFEICITLIWNSFTAYKHIVTNRCYNKFNRDQYGKYYCYLLFSNNA